LREVERESSREGEKGLEEGKLEEPRGDRDSRSLIEVLARIIAYWGKGASFHS